MTRPRTTAPQTARLLAARDKRVKVLVHEQNAGHIATYNDGLAVATGDYVALLSADDLLTRDSLTRAVALMEHHPRVGFVYGYARSFVGEPHEGVGRVRNWSIYPRPPVAHARRATRPVLHQQPGGGDAARGAGADRPLRPAAPALGRLRHVAAHRSPLGRRSGQRSGPGALPRARREHAPHDLPGLGHRPRRAAAHLPDPLRRARRRPAPTSRRSGPSRPCARWPGRPAAAPGWPPTTADAAEARAYLAFADETHPAERLDLSRLLSLRDGGSCCSSSGSPTTSGGGASGGTARDRDGRASPGHERPSEAPDKGSRIARGLGWSLVWNVVLRIGNLLVSMLVARLIAPEQFGVFAVALTVWTILGALAEFGLGTDLIRADDLERRAPTVATLALGLAAGSRPRWPWPRDRSRPASAAPSPSA